MNLIRFDYNEDRLRKIPCFLEECLLTGDLVKIGGLQDFTYIFIVYFYCNFATTDVGTTNCQLTY